ncbi:hypothetical protein [Sphingobium yanoikuyae]|uniref:hypothetical protein n=1 Tax=Sphingobium yanoikuyae TaxID=13690 RepID=UPI003F003084
MDKLIYLALGIGAIIVAASDQDGESQPGKSSPTIAPAAAMHEQSRMILPAKPSGNAAPSVANEEYLEPVNPIPEAADLGGRVIQDRFQSDG